MSDLPRATCRVDLSAIRANVATLRDAAPSAEVMAVVKADGYGHGMIPSARAALLGGATWLGVAFLDEALELRAAGIDAPVLAWLIAPGEDVGAAVEAGIDLSVNAVWGLEEIVAAATRTGRTAAVHLKIDTGLGRAGATRREWPVMLAAAARAQASGAVDIVGVWSHFAYADAPRHPTVRQQLLAYRAALELAAEKGIRPQVRHLANSAATLAIPDAHFDLVRPGVSVYGLSPGPEVGSPRDLGLRPAMTLTAHVALAKRVGAGQGVSYGHRYVTERETTLAVVPLGYGDGVPRHASNIGEVQLGGKRRRVAGTVCMDQFVVDVGDDNVRAGDPVVLFGPGDHGEPTATDWAAAIGTINYEIVTRVGVRVPRVHVGAVA